MLYRVIEGQFNGFEIPDQVLRYPDKASHKASLGGKYPLWLFAIDFLGYLDYLLFSAKIIAT
jgi:hypothetical protein